MQREAIYNQSLRHFLGPVHLLLDDPEVSEIMIVGPRKVYCEKAGLVETTNLTFPDEPWLAALVQNLAEYVGRSIGPARPTLDARLPTGQRVHVVIPPASRQGTCLTIRCFRKEQFSLADLVRERALTPELSQYLEQAVVDRRNIVIAGGSGAGKTTLLDALSAVIPDNERIIVIEDTSELKLDTTHTIYLEAQHALDDEEHSLGIRELFVNSLRMRPDRIIIGEVRRGEALDLIQAMISGHSGALTTLHATTPADAATRLETLCMLGETSLPIHVARVQVAAALDLVVQIARTPGGPRRVTTVAECLGLDDAQRYQWREVFCGSRDSQLSLPD